MIQTRPLFRLTAEVATPQVAPNGPYGDRRFIPVTGGAFAGERLSGRILPGGADCQLIRPDGIAELDVRVTLQAEDGATLYACSQGPHTMRELLANNVFHVPESAIRVVSPDVGGGFDMKADPYPEDALVLRASKRLGRLIKWVATRSDALLGDTHARDQLVFAEMALDADGKILGVRARSHTGLEAYFSAAVTETLMFSLSFIPNAHDVQAIEVTNSAVFTHTPPNSVYRGAGRPESIYLIERLMDRAAAEIGIDPAELRRRNLIAPAALPYHTPTHNVYDSGDFADMLDKGLKLADWDGFEARRAASEKNGKRRGRAVIFYIERGGIFNERMELRCDPSGTVTIVADKAMPFAAMVHGFYFPGGITDQFGLGLEARDSHAGDPCNFPNGSHVCEIKIDPETGSATIERYCVIDDVGRITNPLICHGQIHGGIAQGVGQAMMENMVFDDTGQMLSGSILDYCMPRADDFCDIAAELEEVPCATNPLGVKGIGEAGTIGAPPTIVNAILDALRPLGIDHIDMPGHPPARLAGNSRDGSGVTSNELQAGLQRCPTRSGRVVRLQRRLHAGPGTGLGRVHQAARERDLARPLRRRQNPHRACLRTGRLPDGPERPPHHRFTAGA